MTRTPRNSRGPLTRRSLVLGAGALIGTGLLAACGEEPAAPSVPTGPAAATPFPVADEAQLARIMTDLVAHLDAADAAHDAAQLAPRITGTAAEIRTKAYEIIATVPEFADTLEKPSADIIVPITSISDAFPRQAIAVVRDQNPDALPYFVALQQADARSPYVSWGWAGLTDGDDLPEVNDATNGAEAVAADAEGLVMTPAEALARYAQVLSVGDGADPDDKLVADAGQQATHHEIQAERAALNQGVAQDAAATVSELYQVHDGEYLGLRTADGGALVMATMRSTRTVSVKPNATVTYPESTLTKLAGRTAFTQEFVRDSAEVIAMHIPTADSGKQIRTVGATKALLGAHGS